MKKAASRRYGYDVFFSALVLIAAAFPPAGAVAAEVAEAQPSPAAFDEAFDRFLLEGLTPTRNDEAILRPSLEALLPRGDVVRRRRLEALACHAIDGTAEESLARADLLIAMESGDEGDAIARSLAHACRAIHMPESGPLGPAIASFDAAVDSARRAEHPKLLIQLLINRSGAHSLDGQYARALLDALEADDALQKHGDAFMRALNMQFVGIAYRRMGDLELAEQLLMQSLQNTAMDGQWVHRIAVLLQLGYLYEDTKRYENARQSFNAAIALCTTHNSPIDCAYARLGLASTDAVDKRPRAALRTLERVEADFAEAGISGESAMMALVRGQALAALGRQREALTMLDSAITIWRSEGNDRYLAMALEPRAAVLQGLGRPDDALSDLREYLEVFKRENAERAEQRTEFLRERFESRRRDFENADLRAKERLRRQEIESLDRLRQWQNVAIALGVALVLLLFGITMRQLWRARHLKVLSETDALTGAPNRRALLYEGQRAFLDSRRRMKTLTVLALDIDHFKRINDAYGHATGDAVLARIAKECERTLRQRDLIGRIGGEEFAGLLPETSLDAAVQVAERIRGGVEGLDLDDLAPGLRVTISLGVAALDPHDADFATLLHRADKALYRAKETGRNRVEVAATP
ncbi:diguanylate cyclase [Silanimonas sp.]|uniref:diguanylate cyclase n=1 Tax=Silanimonas sp. TaxID=1929290 RepID=UPI0037CA26A3